MNKARIRIKKPISAVLILLLVLGVAACGSEASKDPQDPVSIIQDSDTPVPEAPQPDPPQQPEETPQPPADVELIVFAAASMTDTLEEIAIFYKDVAPHITLVFNFDSSGTLKTQIEEGADSDLFISAAQRQMNELEELGMILQETRANILENRVALVAAPDNPKNITGFESLAEALMEGGILLAIGNNDVPVGQYTLLIFEYFELDEEALASSGVLTYGSNVKEVTTQVIEASVDAGIVYTTDAFSAGLDIVEYATPEMCGQVIYPAAVLAASANPEEAQAFLEFLLAPDAMKVFESVGFSAP